MQEKRKMSKKSIRGFKNPIVEEDSLHEKLLQTLGEDESEGQVIAEIFKEGYIIVVNESFAGEDGQGTSRRDEEYYFDNMDSVVNFLKSWIEDKEIVDDYINIRLGTNSDEYADIAINSLDDIDNVMKLTPFALLNMSEDHNVEYPEDGYIDDDYFFFFWFDLNGRTSYHISMEKINIVFGTEY